MHSRILLPSCTIRDSAVSAPARTSNSSAVSHTASFRIVAAAHAHRLRSLSHVQVRYRDLKRNTLQLKTLFTLFNLWMVHPRMG